MARVSLSLPDQMVDDLDYLSKILGINRSAVLVTLSSEPVHDLASLVREIPDAPGHDDLLRLRGRSVELINQRMSELKKLGGFDQ